MPPTASEVATHWRDMREAIMAGWINARCASHTRSIVGDSCKRREMTIRQTILLGAILGMLLSPAQSRAFLSSPSSHTTGGSVTPHLRVDPGGSISLIWKDARDSQSGYVQDKARHHILALRHFW